jgi:hypothetical protein
MKDYILTKFNFNREKLVGNDGRFHTVYFIEFDSGHFYIGKHTSDNLDDDSYVCSSKLANRLIEQNTKYYREILFYTHLSSEAIEVETLILQNNKIFKSDLCLNCYPGSPPDSAGTVVISKGTKIKMINPKLLDVYLESGWKRGGIKRVWITKSSEDKFIRIDEIDEYISNGWVLGNSRSKGCVFIMKDGKRKYIKKEFLDEYIDQGWIKKHNIEVTKVYRNSEDKIIKIFEEEIEYWVAKGFLPSSTVHNLIYIKNGKQFKRVKINELDEYLKKGWTTGNNTSGKTYINNGITEKRIYEEEISQYPGWNKGRIRKIYMKNGLIERRVMITNQKLIEDLIKDGFTITLK